MPMTYADPAKVEPHFPVAGVEVSKCTACKHVYGRSEADPVHWVEQPCIWKCGTIVPPGQYECQPCARANAERRAIERDARLAGLTLDPPAADPGEDDPEEDDRKREGQNPLYREAKQYAATYAGTFDFMLSMKQRVTGPKGPGGRGPLTDKQVAAILRIKERDLAYAARANAAAQRVQTGRDLTVLPVGRTYAAVENDSGALTFLIIDVPAPGNRWEGWAFVKQQQGGEEVRLGSQKPGETYVGQWANLIDKVLADPIAAVARYGLELGICGICARPLTNEESRTLGMGPICRARLQKGLDA